MSARTSAPPNRAGTVTASSPEADSRSSSMCGSLRRASRSAAPLRKDVGLLRADQLHLGDRLRGPELAHGRSLRPERFVVRRESRGLGAAHEAIPSTVITRS
ncbi:hypothetical protein [Streptomyces sp. NPDC007856]|uniref:hypothetical protein n=1 Tax=Streptomyces sp. NPDC007856 TaxID=3364781 RepID=UPI00369B2E24